MFATIWKIGSYLNEKLEDQPPLVIIAGTLAVVAVMQNANRIHHTYLHMRYGNGSTRDIKKYLIDKAYSVLKRVPQIRAVKDTEVKKMLLPSYVKMIEEIKKSGLTSPTMPKKSMPAPDILKMIATDLQTHNHKGRLSGGMYADHDKETIDLLGEVYKLTAFTNPMHSIWLKINAIEAQMIAWFHHLFNNPQHHPLDELPKIPPGFVTDGGTTSIVEACRAHVLYAKKVKGITTPIIIVPETAHIAFDNAAETLGAILMKIPVNKKTGAADVNAMEKCITRNTCMIVGSAPSFPCGIFDPIEALGSIALKHKIPLHVDACLGGFFNAFARKAGHPVPRFDFSVPGVSSISADTHKYGQGPKGSSVILFHPKCPATSVFDDFDWKGGIYVTSGLKGSRRGDASAVLWALINAIGEDRYIQITKDIMDLTLSLAARVKTIPGIVLRYEPQFPLLTFDTEKGINSHVVASQFASAHWEINMINPKGFHFCLTYVHTQTPNFMEDFEKDLRAATEFARLNPSAKPKDMAKVYGTMESMPFPYPTDILREIAESYVAINTTLPAIDDDKEEKQVRLCR